MLHDATPATDKRAVFSAALASGRLIRFPGAFSPLSAMLIARHRFDGVYLSGADLSVELGLPDFGLITATELAERAGQIARVIPLPTLADAATGSGAPIITARTVQALEDAGVAGMRISDQARRDDRARRDSTVRHIAAAVAARRDPGFVIAAETDAGPAAELAEAIDRAQAYADAGADLICPTGLADPDGLERFRADVDEPLLVDMTEFRRTTPLATSTLQCLGINVAVYPALLLPLAMAATDDALAQLAADGTHEQLADPVPRGGDRSGLLGYLLQDTFDDCIHDLVG